MSPDGTKWPPPRKFATGYAVAIAVLIVNLIITFSNLNSISRIWDALALSHDIVVGLDDVLSNLRDAETGQRGYLLTGDERYLEPYTKSHSVVTASIDRLRSLVENNGIRREHLNAVAEAASAKLSELETTIKLRRGNGFEAALSVVKTDRGRAYMDQVRGEIAAMAVEENATRVRLKEALQGSPQRSDAHLHDHLRPGPDPPFRRPSRERTEPQGASPTRRLVIDDAPQHG